MEGRIYVSACGLGLGHVSRCLEAVRRLQRKGSFQIVFSTYLDGVALVRAEGFPLVKPPPFSYWTWPDGAVDPWRTLKWLSGRLLYRFMLQVKFELKRLAAFRPHIVVADTRLSTVVAAWMLRIPVISVLNQFRVVSPGLIHYPRLFKLSDVFSHGLIEPGWGLSREILIPDFPPPYTISGENLRVPPALQRKIRHVGPVLPVRPEQLPSQETLKAKFGFQTGKPLVYAAASGPLHERQWLGEKLVKAFSNPQGFNVAVSLGDRRLEGVVARRGSLTVYGWLPERFEMLKACDLLVGRSSHGTLTQALAYGKPLLLIPTQEQTEQIFNARTAVRLGVAKALDPRYLSPKTLLPLVDELLANPSYRRRAEAVMRFSKGLDGAEAIASRVLAALKG